MTARIAVKSAMTDIGIIVLLAGLCIAPLGNAGR